eukprot:gene11985-5386_t
MSDKSEMSREEVEKHFGQPLHFAAAFLGISVDALRKECRRLNIKRWPSKNYKDTNPKKRTGSTRKSDKTKQIKERKQQNKLISQNTSGSLDTVKLEFDQEIDDIFSSDSLSNDSYSIFSLDESEVTHIFDFLDFSSVVKVSMVCIEFHRINQPEISIMKGIFGRSNDHYYTRLRIPRWKLLEYNKQKF